MLGIVFGNFGKHNTVLIKELRPGFPAAHQPQLVPGLKLKAVQGVPTGTHDALPSHTPTLIGTPCRTEIYL